MVIERTAELTAIGLTRQDIKCLDQCDPESQRLIHDWLDRRQVVLEQRNPKPAHTPLFALMALIPRA